MSELTIAFGQLQLITTRRSTACTQKPTRLLWLLKACSLGGFREGYKFNLPDYDQRKIRAKPFLEKRSFMRQSQLTPAHFLDSA